MRVLLMEADPYEADEASRRLRAAGHEVSRCFEADLPSFPCAALAEGGCCPIDAQTHAVAVIVRHRPWPSPMALERGAVCGIRAGIPLIVLTRHSTNPWTAWASAVVNNEDELVKACDHIANDVTPAAVVSMPPDATVQEALAALAASHQSIGILSEPDAPIAIVTLDELSAATDANDAVGDIATRELVQLPSVTADPLTTVRAYTAAAWRGLRRRRPGADRSSRTTEAEA